MFVASGTNAHVSAAAVAAMLIPVTAGAVTWATLSTAVSTFIPTAASAYPLLTAVYLPIVLVSGAIGHPAQPDWLATVVSYLPARPMIVAATEALRHPGTVHVLTLERLLVLFAWTVFGFIVALVSFRWDDHRSSQPWWHRLIPAWATR